MSGVRLFATVAGLAAVRKRLAALPDRLRDETDVALGAIGDDIVGAARQSLQAAGLAARDGSSASPPGAPPRDPGGSFAASLTATLDPDEARLAVGSTSPHARYLEYGTRRMAARPFLRPAIEATREAAQQHLRAALTRAAAAWRGGA